jgi:phage anti-repressor protein
MGQILSLNQIISIVEIKSSSDMKIYPAEEYIENYDYIDCEEYIKKSREYNPDRIFDNPEYSIDYILNIDLVEERVITNCVEDSYGIILDIV